MTYTIAQREAHAEQAVLLAAAGGWLDKTSCTQIAHTYGVPEYAIELKAMKARFRNELSFSGDGK